MVIPPNSLFIPHSSRDSLGVKLCPSVLWEAPLCVTHSKYLMHVCMLRCLSQVHLFATLWTVAPTKLLCPWDSPGKNTGLGGQALSQGIFPTQKSNLKFLHLLHCRQILHQLSHQRSPKYLMIISQINDMQSYLGGILGMIPDSCNKASHTNFWLPNAC